LLEVNAERPSFDRVARRVVTPYTSPRMSRFENATNLDTNRVWKYRWRVQFTSEVRDNVDFIKISGRMIHDGSLFRLREHVLYKLQSDIRRFVIDISEVPHLDSSGCGEVISAHTSILRENGALAFVNPTERVRLLWEWTRIREVLHIFDTLDEARQFVCKFRPSTMT